MQLRAYGLGLLSFVGGILLVAGAAHAVPDQAFYGDTHVHTALSFDSFTFGNRNMPDDAYRYAKGGSLMHPAGFEMKLSVPLDFAMVSDHAIYLGMLPAMYDDSTSVYQHPLARLNREAEGPLERRDAFNQLLPYVTGQVEEDDLFSEKVFQDAWHQVVDAAEKHNDPGSFTTFVGYEFTTSDFRFENLHRNVLFKGRAPARPLPRSHPDVDRDPERLWDWMDALRADGMDSMAIPHNSNGSNGRMFALDRITQQAQDAYIPEDQIVRGPPIDAAYVKQRIRNEPIVELTQVKGTSETTPELSPEDEWANFEVMPVQIASWFESKQRGSYVRDAYRTGLQLESRGMGNPFEFGVIGASDTHVAAGSFDEDNYWSKIGMVDATAQLRGSVPIGYTQRLFRWALQAWMDLQVALFGPPDTYAGQPWGHAPSGYVHQSWKYWGASGLAGVWAEENTRESIFDALRRKEVFATSGPRMAVRLFASYDFDSDANWFGQSDLLEQAYARGVPMGGRLPAQGDSQPAFLVWATADVRSGPLQRLQMVKGWLDSTGQTHERVYDVACAGGAQVQQDTHRCPDNDAQVDTQTCAYSSTTAGDPRSRALQSYWQDPDFKSGENAFYYARALEDPSCRWSTWDAIRAGTAPNPSLEPTIQERVWSSPIWYGQF
ncbi:MAG: DUF3604 domain-containing protein [Gammaproteobacteria bacterium]